MILLVEDDENDVALVRRAFAKAGSSAAMKVVKSAEEAMAYLKNEPPYENREENPAPGLVLLDLKLPGLDGFELLRWIRSQTELEGLRVCVLTSSPLYRDLCHAHQLGANSFLTKPLERSNVDALCAAMHGPMRWLGELPYGVRRDASR